MYVIFEFLEMYRIFGFLEFFTDFRGVQFFSFWKKKIERLEQCEKEEVGRRSAVSFN